MRANVNDFFTELQLYWCPQCGSIKAVRIDAVRYEATPEPRTAGCTECGISMKPVWKRVATTNDFGEPGGDDVRFDVAKDPQSL